MAGYAGWVANDPSGGASTASEAAVKDKVGKRFKSVPSTQAEVQDCSLKLSSRRLAKITFGPATIAFGTVCTESRTKRAFVVVNNLEEYIHVALTIDPDGPLRHTSPQAQVIPPGETAAFVICLTPEHVQDLRLVVPYTVNSAHVLNFTVTAQVTPMDLTMSTNLLQFTFAHDSLEFTTARRLILSNPCGAPARFSWVVPDPTLSFVPQSGTIAPHKDFDVHILYRPAIERALNAQCTLQIVGGSDKHLTCTSDAISARCSLSPATVDVGTVAVGVQTTTTTSIVNHGQHQAVFAVGPCPAEIIVQPQKGKIPPGQSLPLRIETCLSTPATVHEVIQIDVRGCPSIPLSIRCSAVLPTVSVAQDEIDFGSVTLSGRVTVDVSIVSTSPVTATVYLDLSAPLYNELRVSGPLAALMPASDSSPIGYISKYDLQRALVSSKDIAVGTSSASNGIEGPRIFRLTIAPGATVQFTLMFSPIVVGEHTIPLPLILAGMPSSYQGIRRMIHAQGLKPKVVLSSSTISFGERIVLRSGKTRSGGYTSSFTITNDDLSQVQWSLVGDNDPVADPIWRVEPAQGLLMKGDSSTVKVTFVPTTSGSFEKVLSLYLGANRAEPYMQVVLRGSAEHPMLKFDTIEMVLPVVPLGVRSEMRVVISNSGYDRVTVGYHLPKDTVHIPLEVGFPEGNTLGNERQSIPVVVTFLADRPTAFAAAIDFTDGDGNRFPLPVAGVSDNSVLSCWAFLSRRRYSLRSVEGHAITCVDLGPRAPAPVSAGLISSENIRPASEVTAAASILLRFLAAQNLLDLSVDGFPAELVSSGGEQVVRLVEFLSGRKLGKRDAQGDADLTARYDALLACLRSNGALLTTKAEHLGTSSVMLASTPFGSWERQALEKLYPSVSRLAWLDVLAQIVKVFLLGRVTAKTVGGPTIADRATTSNIFSPPECLLLAWLEHHCASRFPAAKRSVRNFDSDLRDGVVLAALMFTYQPHLKQLASVSLDADGDEQKMLSNVQKVVSAMEESNLEFLLTPPAILSPNPRDMLLFVLYLFFTLPGFTPQSRVEFKGIVQKDILKNVVLRNPTASEIAYDVRLVGCPDFQVAAKSVVLGPRASESVAISFRGRFTREDAARLWFTPRRQLADRPPKALVRPMIFDLVSAVTASPTPHASLTVRAKLYDSMQVAVDVTNPFDRDCTFVVDATRQSVARNGPRLKNASASTPTVPPVVFPNAFAFDRKSVTVKRGATERLLGTFKPLCDGVHACQVNLCDDKVGELRIEVTGYVDGPNPFGDVLRVTCKENTSVVKEVPLTCANPLLERARPLPTSTKSSAKDEPKSAEFLPMPLTYACESSSPYAIVPRTITLSEKPSGSRAAKPKEGAAPSNEPGHQDDNVLRVTFRGGQPGTYPVEVTLRSELDVRVLQLEFLVQSEGMRAALEFEVAAGQLVRQLVPIVNNSDNEWRLTAEITGPGWSGPPAITVPKRSAGEYPLDFRPQWICQVEGALVLTNATNKQTYTFQLKGVSKEPLPVRFVQIKCNARESSEHTFTVENGGNDDVEYRVESDLPYVGGDSTLKVPARSRRDYRLVLTPQLGGQFSGSLTFVTADGQYQWFAVDVTASRPAAESTVSISAPLRQAATAELELSNPLGTPMSFDVRIEGDYLDGPDRLSLAPSSSATYALVYAPLRTGPASGSVHFVNPTIGEFWYELDLSCLEPEPVRLALLECEAGSQAAAKVTLANPTDEAVEVVPVSTQPKNFSVRPAHIQLPASGAFVAQIVYTPSTLNEVQSAEVRFSSGIAGDWVFHVSGVGLPPTALPPIRLVSPVRQRLSSLVQFRNPFDDPMRVHVSLVEDGTSNFHLFMKRTTARVAGQATLQIPFFYKPNDLARTTAQIVVEASSGLRWMYPLVGEADIHSADRQQFTCPARATLSKAITLGLPGVTEADIDRDTFTTDLRFVDCTPNDIAQATLSQSFSVGARAARPHLTPQGPVLQFDVAMTPLRSMTANALLVVSKSSGCQWTFDVRFVVSEPDVDDVIRITADLNQVGNVSFRLTNVASEPAPFQAAFSSDAPCQLSVHPTSGVLAPRDSLGTLFIVSFAPTAYGKVVVGRLQIRTADMEWAYEVRGSHPHYAPPRGRHTFSSFIDEATMKRLQSANSARAKNFLSDNIRAASSRRKPAPPGTARSRRL